MNTSSNCIIIFSLLFVCTLASSRYEKSEVPPYKGRFRKQNYPKEKPDPPNEKPKTKPEKEIKIPVEIVEEKSRKVEDTGRSITPIAYSFVTTNHHTSIIPHLSMFPSNGTIPRTEVRLHPIQRPQQVHNEANILQPPPPPLKLKFPPKKMKEEVAKTQAPVFKKAQSNDGKHSVVKKKDPKEDHIILSQVPTNNLPVPVIDPHVSQQQLWNIQYPAYTVLPGNNFGVDPRIVLPQYQYIPVPSPGLIQPNTEENEEIKKSPQIDVTENSETDEEIQEQTYNDSEDEYEASEKKTRYTRRKKKGDTEDDVDEEDYEPRIRTPRKRRPHRREEEEEEDDGESSDEEYEASYKRPVTVQRHKPRYGKLSHRFKGDSDDDLYEDQVESASGGHGGHGGHGGGGGGGGKSSSQESGGGSSYDGDHYSKKGSKGSKGHKKGSKQSKSNKGHHDKEEHGGHYSDEKSHADKSSEGGGHYGEHQEAEGGKKGHKYGEGGKHKKGRSTKGEHNVVKKDEFKKSTVFYDEDHEGGNHEKHGDFYGENSKKKGGHKKGGYKKAQSDEGSSGKKGHFDKGHHDEEHAGHDSDEGHDEYYEHDENYGDKKGNKGGKQWSYKSGSKH